MIRAWKLYSCNLCSFETALFATLFEVGSRLDRPLHTSVPSRTMQIRSAVPGIFRSFEIFVDVNTSSTATASVAAPTAVLIHHSRRCKKILRAT
jgi:hypothetical protein